MCMPRSLFTGLMAYLLSACAPPAPTVQEPQEQASAKTYRVDLPKFIDLEALMPELKHSDNTYRVDGLLMRSADHLEEELEVTGYLTELSPKCPTPKKGEIVNCPQPYFLLTDVIGESIHKLKVADMDRKQLSKFQLNKKYRVKGVFQTSSKSGYLSSEGLLTYQSSQLIKE